MTDNIYVHADGNNYGPLTTEDVKTWAREGRLSGDQYVWLPARNQWVRALDVDFLAAALKGSGDGNYYVRVGDDTVGPLDLNDVFGLIGERRFNAMDFIWLEADRRWARAGEVPFLSPYFLKQIREQVEEDRSERELQEIEAPKAKKGPERRDAALLPAWRTEIKHDLGRADDQNYLKTLAAMFLIHILVIMTVNFVEVPEREEIKPAEVLGRIAKLVVDKPVEIPVEPLVQPDEIISTTGGGGAAAGGGGGGQGGEDYASVGVVGLLTVIGPDGSVADLMGAGGDLDAVASSIAGLKTSGSGTVGRGTGGGFGPGGPGLGGGLGPGFAGLLATKGSGTTKLKAGRVRVSPPGITGAAATNSLRSSAVIARIVNQHKNGIEFIYKKYLKTNPSLEGKIVVRFTISAGGAVTACSAVSSTIGNPALEGEVCARIMTWRFPPIDAGDVTVVYPFVFFSAGA